MFTLYVTFKIIIIINTEVYILLFCENIYFNLFEGFFFCVSMIACNIYILINEQLKFMR